MLLVSKCKLSLLVLLLFAIVETTWGQAPVITAISPEGGPVGTVVTVLGSELQAINAATVGGVDTLVISRTAGSAKILVMPGATRGPVSVTSTLGTAASHGAFTVTSAGLPTSGQGPRLAASDNAGSAGLGQAIAISADGNTVAASGIYDNNLDGAVWVFTRADGIWSQQGTKLTGSNGQSAQQGVGVAISADGNSIVFGGTSGNNNVGAAWVFIRSGNSWTEQASRAPNDNAAWAGFGSSVALAADGKTLVIGGSSEDNGSGAAWIFKLTNGTWLQAGSKLVASDAAGYSFFGHSAAVSADGKTVALGGYFDAAGIGATWVFTENQGTYTQQGPKLVASAYVTAPMAGFSVALSYDGNTLITGGTGDNNSGGAAWVFVRKSGLWKEQAKLVGTGSVGFSNQGYAVCLSADGNLAAVSGPSDNNYSGSIWLFKRQDTTWTQTGSKLTGANAIEAAVGSSMALSPGGNTLAAGGFAANGFAGGVWFFASDAPTVTSISPTSGPVGTLVTISGKFLAQLDAAEIGGVPALLVNRTSTSAQVLVMPGTVSGAASVFAGNGTVTSSQTFAVTATLVASLPDGAKILGTGATQASTQGTSVAVSADGNTIALGGLYDNAGAGAVWVFVRTANGWTQQGSKLSATGTVAPLRLGTSLAISADGNTILTGATVTDGGAGGAWVFTRVGTTWSQQGSRLFGTGSQGACGQGWSVALSGDGNTAVVGGPNDDNYKGATWVFTRNDGVWTQQGNKLIGSASENSIQGLSVAISADGQTIATGAPYADGSLGAIWIYARSGNGWIEQAKVRGSNYQGQPFTGSAVALSADGNTLLFGGRGDSQNGGAGWVFARSNGSWTQLGNKLIASNSIANGNLGYAAGLSADGTQAYLGAPYVNSYKGVVYAFSLNGNQWTEQANFVPTGLSDFALAGQALALSSDGNALMVGAGNDDGGIGGVWSFVTDEGPLPVELTSFTARLTAGNTAMLEWATAGERNNRGFYIEQATAIGVKQNAGERLAFVESKGNEQGKNSYILQTRPLQPGDHYFRLVQQDVDGKETPTAWLFVRVGANTNPDLAVEVFPNPTRGSLSARFFHGNEEAVRTEIFDLSGKLIFTEENQLPSQSAVLLYLPTDGLGAGTYLLRIATASGVASHRFVKE